jgi:predicted DNA binding CopG/RHH family protein
MKEPSLKNLRFDDRETQRIRQLVAAKKKIKITVNLDSDVLDFLKKEALDSGVPYQKLLNVLLIEAIDQRKKAPSRLDKLEQVVEQLKEFIPRGEGAAKVKARVTKSSRARNDSSSNLKPKRVAVAR